MTSSGPPEQSTLTPTGTRRRWPIIGLALVVTLVALELFARFYLGLGDFSVMMRDPDIEYRYRPSQEGSQFGKQYYYNQYSMRSEDFPAKRSNPEEVRVMILSDSIMHGGNWMSNSEIAASLMKGRLEQALDDPVIVANASTGSWGPQTYLAYAKRFGFFDADVVIILLNSRDYVDIQCFNAPTSIPETSYMLALGEIVAFRIPLRIAPLLLKYGLREETEGEICQRRIVQPGDRPLEVVSMEALAELLDMSLATGAEVIVAQYLEQVECEGEPKEGYHAMKEVAKSKGIEPLQLGPALCGALESGVDVYYDGLHASWDGHEILADQLTKSVLRRLDKQ